METIYCEDAILGDATDVDRSDLAYAGEVHGAQVIQGDVFFLNEPQPDPSQSVSTVPSRIRQYNVLIIPDVTASDIQELAEKTGQTFARLADEWEHDIAGSSLIQDMVDHPKYREIIGLGRDAIPFILERLSTQGGFWFGALHEISGEFAPSEDDLGNREKMTAAWLRWGRENDFSS